jgi:hypothetical protein
MFLWEADALDFGALIIYSRVAGPDSNCFGILEKIIYLAFKSNGAVEVVGVTKSEKLTKGSLEASVITDTHAIMFFVFIDLEIF